jgi:hypothetical protein
MGVNWGVPVQRKKKVEQFSTPVVTLAALAGKGSGRKIMFNKAAQDALGLVSPDEDNSSYVSIGKDTDTGEVAIMASLKEVEGVQSFKTNKSFAFSNAKTYDFVVNTLGLTNSVTNHLHIEEVEGEGYFKVVRHEADATVEDTATNEGEEPADVNGTEAAAVAATEEEPAAPVEGGNVAQAGKPFAATGEEAEEEEATAPAAEATEETKEEEW